MTQSTGIVTWFDTDEGWGWITSDHRGPAYRFTHASLNGTTFGLTAPGHRVAFDSMAQPGRRTAHNVIRIG